VDIYCIYTHRDIPSAKFPQDNYTNGWPERLYNFVKDYNGTRSKELWVYHTHDRWPNPDTDLYMTGLMQRISFWEHWEYNFSGWLYWSFNWGMDMDGGVGYAGYGESSLVTWGYNEMPIGSIRLQRVLDGIEDYEYFWLLNSSIAKLNSMGYHNESEKCSGLLHEISVLLNQPQYMKYVFMDAEYRNNRLWKTIYNPYYSQYVQLRNAIGLELSHISSLGAL
ncbi:MAG: hypothetical protein ACTSXF_01400, partial [Promethearchaeota archaeon]